MVQQPPPGIAGDHEFEMQCAHDAGGRTAKRRIGAHVPSARARPARWAYAAAGAIADCPSHASTNRGAIAGCSPPACYSTPMRLGSAAEYVELDISPRRSKVPPDNDVLVNVAVQCD